MDRILDLLVQWELGFEEGQAIEIEQLCPDWPEGAAELRRHVQQLAEVNRILDLRELDDPATDLAQGLDRESLPTLPDYEITGVLGRGGMGTIFVAQHRLLERRVAIKVLRQDRMPSRSRVRRVIREAQALARLRHPNIVSIFEARVHEDRLFLVMELVDGGSLADRVDEFVQDSAKAARVVELIAAAVQHAHEHRVLHRDLKPANILLGDDGAPRVADFGLARFIESADFSSETGEFAVDDAADTATRPLTQAGLRPGTPPYMAPEQFRTEIAPVNARTDVWAIGVILYELLTGHRPFEGSATDIRQSICDKPQVELLWPQVNLDAGLAAIVDKCLRRNPSDRYPTAGAVARELGRWRTGDSMEARPHGWGRRGSKWIGRHRMTLAGILMAVLALAAWIAPGSQPVREIPATQTKELSEEEAFERDMRPALRALAAGQPVPLISELTTNLPHRWRTGGDVSVLRLLTDDPDGASVFASSRSIALLELSPDPRITAYRLVVTLRQDSFLQNLSNVGVYFAQTTWTNGSGSQHSLCRCVFADLGPNAVRFGGQNRERGSRVQCGPGWIGSSSRIPLRTHFCESPAMFYVPEHPMRPPGPWQTIRIEVRPNEVKAFWQEELVGTISQKRWATWFESLAQRDPELAGFPARDTFGGSIGLYLNGASASVRQFKVEPLAE
jgi:tRNA A-37 threonylcarbamoyl transferase component Bud32